MKPYMPASAERITRVRAIVVAIHGILTRTTDPSWPDHLDAYLSDCKVEKRRYLAGPFPVWNVFVENRSYASALAEEIEVVWERLRVPVHFVGHSNGCDVALKTITNLAKRSIRVETVILTASVTDPDVDRSGVAKLIDGDQLGKAFAYCSRSDIPLRLPLKWPYRDLGRQGWTFNGAPYEEPRIRTRRFDTFGHGSYFDQENVEKTFAQMREDMGL